MQTDLLQRLDNCQQVLLCDGIIGHHLLDAGQGDVCQLGAFRFQREQKRLEDILQSQHSEPAGL